MSIGLTLHLFVQDCNPCQSKWLSDRTGEFGPHTEDPRPDLTLASLSGAGFAPYVSGEKKRRLLVPGLYYWSLPMTGVFYHPRCLPLVIPFYLSNTGATFLRLSVFVKLVFLGYCLLPGLSERMLPEKISYGVQTVAPSLFSLLRKRKIFKYLHA